MTEQVTTQNDDGTTTASIPLSSMSLEELVQISQGLGRKRDQISDQMRYIRGKINERLAMGERESSNAMKAAAADAPAESPVDGVAPGSLIEASAGG